MTKRPLRVAAAGVSTERSVPALDVGQIRGDFPILNRRINGKPLIYLDNSATTQMPEPVLQVMIEQLHNSESNVHRGIHTLSEESTQRMEQAREQMRRFLGAAHPEEIIFTSGTTGAINLLARSMSFGLLRPGDEVVTTRMEHHANLIPWQQACARTGASLKVVPIDSRGDLDMDAFAQALSARTKLVAAAWVSNVTGAVNPMEKIISMAHRAGAWVLVDGAQAVRHAPMDVQKLDCDFFALSGHKMMGPTGTGILYGKRRFLEQLPLDSFGGGMVDRVTQYGATFADLPYRLEAGTPNIVGNIGLGAAAAYLMNLGAEEIALREGALCRFLSERLAGCKGVRFVGMPKMRAGCVSFNIEGTHCYDAAKLLDQLGIAVRSGHHCAQPLLAALDLTGAVRVSPAFYNTTEEAEAFVRAVDQVSRVCAPKDRVILRHRGGKAARTAERCSDNGADSRK